jgi:hypothetical protein
MCEKTDRINEVNKKIKEAETSGPFLEIDSTDISNITITTKAGILEKITKNTETKI